MTKFEYTSEEKTYIKNKLKNYNRLLNRLVEMGDELLDKKYREWYNKETYPLADKVKDQADGMSFLITHLERCFEDQSISVFDYDDNFQADKKMVRQIRKMIDYYNSKPTIDFRYR